MKPEENIEELIKNIDIDTNAKTDIAVLGDVIEAFEKSKNKKSASTQPNIWRTIIKSRITKLAAAAAVIIAVALSITFLGKSVAPAYAIEQTIEANNSINSYHFKYYSSFQDHNNHNYGLKKEAWVEYDESGNISNVRVNYSWPKQDMVQIWKGGKAQQWSKEHNTLTYLNDEIFSRKVLYFAQRYNPRGAIQYLYERQANGEITIEIEEPSDKNRPITIMANYPPNTYLLGKDISAMREIFFVDQNTKLITAVEIYELKNDEYVGIWRYYDYNKPFDAAIFTLQNEVPDAVIRIYEYASEDAGLEQGDLSDNEIAVKVVREFFEALIAEDFTKAGQLFGGMPATEAQDKFGNLNVLRIASTGEPVQHDKPSSLRVPCTIEMEKDGETIEWQPDGPFVRQVYRHAGRWRIIGGI